MQSESITRFCLRCKQDLPRDQFDQQPPRPDGRLQGPYDRCKSCREEIRASGGKRKRAGEWTRHRPCACGCGQVARGQFIAGHDRGVERPALPVPTQRQKYQESISVLLQSHRDWYSEFMAGRSCQDCGCADLEQLQWHHREPETKVNNVGSMVLNRAQDVVLAEIEKCDLLCVKCHRRAHQRMSIDRATTVV